MTNRLRFICIFLLSFSLTTAQTKDSVSLKVDFTEIPFANFNAFTQEIDHILWQPLSENKGHIFSQATSSWLKINLTNHTDQRAKRFIEFAFPVKSLNLYEVSASGELTSSLIDIGRTHEFSRRPINYRHIIFTAELKPLEEKTYFVHLNHSQTRFLQIKAWTPKAFQQAKSQELVFFGIIYGALLMIIIYNLFIFLSIKEKNHLLFVLFGSFTGVYIAIHEGHFFQFIGVDSQWPKNILYSLVIALMSLFLSLFTSSFLNINRWSKILNKLVIIAGSLCALMFIAVGLSNHIFIDDPQINIILISLYSFCVFCGLFVRNQGVGSAGFFALALFLCTTGFVLEFVTDIGLIAWEAWAFSYTSIGNTLMILVFAFALADKMRLLHNEKLATSLELIKLSEEKAQTNIEVYKSKLNQVQLEQKADEAKIESRAKSEFLATMSHQIRTPMNGVLGMTDLLDDTELDPHQHQLVSSINKSAKSLLNVINDLLDYSKIESGKMDLEAKVFNLERIIDDCIIISALKATETKVQFCGYIVPGTNLQLKGDAPKIRQVTLNLLNNVFSISKNCRVQLLVSETKKSSVNSVEIKINVISKGLLISEQDRIAFIQPFHDTQTKKRNHGHDLGLSISRQLVDLMNGDLGIDTDEENTTTTFWFTCRLLLPHKNEVVELSERNKILSGRRILICDQHEDYTQTVKALTESWGMHCHTFENNEGLADFILSDKNTYQVLLISEDLLTPEIQFAVRKSNLEHNFITSITLLTKSRFSVSKQELTKKGIQNVLEVPSTTFQLYQCLLSSMGIKPEELTKPSDDTLNIIVAEDNTVNQMVIIGLLQKLDYDAKVANNGIETLNLLEKSSTKVDLILMDCEMPELNGYEATKAIRKKQKGMTNQTIIVGLSAHANPEYKDLAFDSGMDDFITKPVTTENLQEIFEKISNGLFKDDSFDSSAMIDSPEENKDS